MTKFSNNTESSLKGFTLLELLIVIGILAILAVAVVMVINPTQLLAQARDSRRLSDLNTLQTALNFYSVESGQDFSSPDHLVYTSLPDTSSDCSSYSLPSLPSGWSYHCVTEDHLRDIDGSGWLPVDFSSLSPSPLSTLPVDPKNTIDYYYTFVKGGSYELNALTESRKYRLGGYNPPNLPGVIAKGTDLNLSPIYNTEGLVGYWSFDEGEGITANDLSGFNNDGIMYSSSTVTDLHTSSGCVLGKCASFDGEDDYVGCGQSSSLNNLSQLTVGIWINITNHDRFGRLVDKRIWTNGTFVVMFSGTSDKIQFGIENDAGTQVTIDSVSSITLGQWTHIAATWDGSDMKIYVNGALDTPTPANQNGTISSTRSIYINSGQTGADNYVDGLIDEVRIYNRALSPSEVQALYEATKP